ncbi:MAG: acetylornithine deacetylase, partial [Bacteroidaceae bacterium]|nr:acetylornithine deacetylase [Bacteroidaceae bacterium]
MTAHDAFLLLDKLIATPSHSREENAVADILEAFLRDKGIDVQRIYNNVWAKNANFDFRKPTLLLNSHHDTVKPSSAYTVDPYTPLHADGKIFGLGSNDAGASLVALT